MIHSGQRKGINMTYKTICEGSITALDTMVKLNLSEGWELYGNQYCSVFEDADGSYSNFFQPMIKND